MLGALLLAIALMLYGVYIGGPTRSQFEEMMLRDEEQDKRLKLLESAPGFAEQEGREADALERAARSQELMAAALQDLVDKVRGCEK